MEKRNVVIYVASQRFSLNTSDTEEYVISIGEKVDTMIRGIQRDNPRFNRDTCATLAALDLCDDETKLRQMLDVLREQVKDYLRDTEQLRAENAELKEQIKSLTEKADSHTPAEKEVASAAVKKVSAQNTSEKLNSTDTSRQTAFAGKDFRGDKKKKKHQHDHRNPYQTKFAQQNNTETKPDEKSQTDLPDDLEFPDTPYQFNIFDDMI